ncbi:MAG: DMT family transporter, partial [Gemmatimonadota bacterium]
MILLVIVAIAIGMVVSAQAGVNAQLRSVLGHPVTAATISFAIGTIALLLAGAVGRIPWPTAGEAARVPWWAWTGGLLGAVYVAASVVLAPRLGAAVLTAALVAGQLAAALVLDHFGLIGFEQKSVNTT